VPRNRTVRLAVLGSSVQRAASSGYPTSRSSALKRRIVVGGLVLLSLVLITVSFRSTALDGAQGTVAGILRPFEVGADRVTRPFRDAVGWVHGLIVAKNENKKLRREIDALRQQAIQNQNAAQENEQLRALLDFRDLPTFPKGYDSVATRVLVQPSDEFDQQVLVAAGSNDGVKKDAPVITADGLVGTVTKVADKVALVTLLTDESSAVSAVDVNTRAPGVVQTTGGGSDALMLQRVTKDQVVGKGDTVVTAGWRSRDLASIYPRGIPVGVVASVGQTDTDLYKQIQIQPFADFSSLDSVLILVAKKPLPRLP
jgi:rod shape-determining protein MreC